MLLIKLFHKFRFRFSVCLAKKNSTSVLISYIHIHIFIMLGDVLTLGCNCIHTYLSYHWAHIALHQGLLNRLPYILSFGIRTKKKRKCINLREKFHFIHTFLSYSFSERPKKERNRVYSWLCTTHSCKNKKTNKSIRLRV